MKNDFNIPDKLRIGWKKDDTCYTQQLGYVIYYDERGKLRKETSWKGWIQHDLGDHSNEPTNGFVLNKGAGGVGSGWGRNDRREKVRVYDPRGFEIEITIPNLMFILLHCTSIKGKGIEGDLVYAWSGPDMILLPVDCPEYKECKEYSENLKGRVYKKDMVEGCLYKGKDMKTLMYLGRNEIYDVVDGKLSDYMGKIHCFHNMESGKKVYEKGFTRLTQKLTEETHDDYATIYTEFYETQLADQIEEYYWEKEIVKIKDLKNLPKIPCGWGYTDKPNIATLSATGGLFTFRYSDYYENKSRNTYSPWYYRHDKEISVKEMKVHQTNLPAINGKVLKGLPRYSTTLHGYGETNLEQEILLLKPRIKMKSGKVLGFKNYV